MTKSKDDIFRKLDKYIKNIQPKNDQEYENAIADFMQKYNNHELDSELTNTEKAYELLERVEIAKSQKEALNLVNQALKLDPDLLDAKVELSELQKDPDDRDRILNEGIECEEKKLRKDGFFDKESIGEFYTIFETRPYIKALFQRVHNLIYDGKMTLARDELLYIIKLNNNDNLGCRYILSAVYAFLEDEKGLLKLISEFDVDQSFMLYFPLYILYYKTNQTKKAEATLDKLKELNEYFPKLTKHRPTKKELLEINNPYYARNTVGEVLHCLYGVDFLITTAPRAEEFAKKYFTKH